MQRRADQLDRRVNDVPVEPDPLGGRGGGGHLAAWLNGPSFGPGWLSTPGTYNDGAWHHVAATYDGATLSIYVDGAVAASAARSGAVATGTSPVQVGQRTNFGGWQGSLDEVAFYDHALAPARLQAHYNAGTSIG